MTPGARIRRGIQRAFPVLLFLALGTTAFIKRELLVAWFTGKPLAGQDGKSISTSAGALELAASLQPDPPRQEDNTLRLTIRDASKQVVEDATVAVEYSMPAMGSMQEMKGTAKVEAEGGGVYIARFALPMGGSWTLAVRVESPAGAATARYGITVGRAGLTQMEGAADLANARPSESAALPEQRFTDGALASLRATFAAYEEIRIGLAADSLTEIGARAWRMAASLRAVASGLVESKGPTKDLIDKGIVAAGELGSAKDLEAARLAFGELSRTLVLLVGADSRLGEGKHVFSCPMAKGYRKWIQTTPELRNPYMGPKMLSCGSEAKWVEPATPEGKTGEADSGRTHADGEIAHYTCSMHPSVKQAVPGTCPICAMDLTPVTKEEVSTGVIFVDSARRQLIGVTTSKVERRQVHRSIRAVGKVAYDESRLADVSLKYKGWVHQVFADSVGKRVKKGHALFTVYSPDVYAAQMELLTALKHTHTGADAGSRNPLAAAARDRLRLWDISSGTIDRVISKSKPLKYVPVISPAGGFVIEKNVVEGSAVEPGARLLRIANLDKVWVEADLYESELPLVKVGQSATITFPYSVSKELTGNVALVYPYLDGPTRTGRVRVVLGNVDVDLKPDMYANVEFEVPRGERLVVPDSAVIFAGPRRIVFIDLGEGRLKPVTVTLGQRSGGWYEVDSGLSTGDQVVTSGNFLVAAESRLKSAEGQW